MTSIEEMIQHVNRLSADHQTISALVWQGRKQRPDDTLPDRIREILALWDNANAEQKKALARVAELESALKGVGALTDLLSTDKVLTRLCIAGEESTVAAKRLLQVLSGLLARRGNLLGGDQTTLDALGLDASGAPKALPAVQPTLTTDDARESVNTAEKRDLQELDPNKIAACSTPIDKLATSSISKAELVVMLRRAQAERDQLVAKNLNLESALTKHEIRNACEEDHRAETAKAQTKVPPFCSMERAAVLWDLLVQIEKLQRVLGIRKAD